MISSIKAAKFIANYSLKQGKAVNLTRLQNTMYLISSDWFHLNFERLYDDQCVETPLGVKYLKVYDHFCAYGGFPIRGEFEVENFSLEYFFIQELERYKNLSIIEILEEVKNRKEGKYK